MDLLTVPVEVEASPKFAAKARRRLAGALTERVLLGLAAIFFALHFIHLRADFPNRSPWMDWAKYTDEGWYGDAAIRHYQLGHWNVPGDFNAAAALPVWPALELVLFRFTGVSVAAARALSVSIFGLTLGGCYLLLRRWPARSCTVTDGERSRSHGPAVAVLLLAVSPFCFVFSRLAILEPLLILEMAAALLIASTAGDAMARAAEEGGSLHARARVSCVALGLMLPVMVLTKTTAVFLFPAISWMLWAGCRYRIGTFARAVAIVGGMGTVAWTSYYLAFVRPHFLVDYRYLFSANAYTGITAPTFWTVLHDTLFDTSWIGKTLFWMAMVAVVCWLAGMIRGRLRDGSTANPLAVALLLWVAGYWTFLAYHANLQPRYYLVLAPPLTMLVAMGFDWLIGKAVAANGRAKLVARIVMCAAVVALAGALGAGAVRAIGYVTHPEYGWVNAAQRVREAVDRERAVHPDHPRLVLSISGSDFSLMTGLPSICDDFGTLTLPERVAKYRPGWFATWNDVEDDKMEALAPLYRLERVLAVPVFDDPERNLLILYRLDRRDTPGAAGRAGRRRYLSVPHHLRTRIGQQPSAAQLQH